MSAFLLRNQSEFIDAVLEDEHRHTGVRNRPKHELKRKLRLSLSELSESISKPKSTTGRIFFIFKNLRQQSRLRTLARIKHSVTRPMGCRGGLPWWVDQTYKKL